MFNFDPVGNFFRDNIINPIQDNVFDPVQNLVEAAQDAIADTLFDPLLDAIGFDQLLSQYAPPRLVDADGATVDAATTPLEGDVVVLIHGWQSSHETFNSLYATIGSKYADKHVLGLDWSELADLPGDLFEFTGFQARPDNTARAISYVAETITTQLQTLFDVTGGELTVIGHSLGSLVASEIGRLYGAMSDPLEQLVALDPAAFAKTYDLDGRGKGQFATSFFPFPGNPFTPINKRTVKDFNTVARESLALVVMEELNPIGGLAGDNDFATTAHDSFLVDLPFSAGAAEKHNAVISVFDSALAANYFSLDRDDFGIPPHTDNLYNNFGSTFGRFLPGINLPGHEGIITADLAGTITQYQPQPTPIAAPQILRSVVEGSLTDEDSTPANPQVASGQDAPAGEESSQPLPSTDELIDLTGMDGALAVGVTLEREAAFDNLLQFYATDAVGAIAGILPGEAGYEDAVRQNLLAQPILSVENGATSQATIVLAGGTFYAPALLIQGNPANLVTLDDGILGSDRMQRDGNVWKFEDASDFDFNDLVLTVTAIDRVIAVSA
ncbi:alpha/beta fold hydrolase [Halomicronema sp. CCY15110]|uniref:alpha/beta fold hydrolase n=1 Tax=Halomicronema sp. CCY15110 TaxID=2767773 RepID=UPI0019521E32|nr:alpha/beta fold hydrolase [Halomicronema sp. CCY15110]